MASEWRKYGLTRTTSATLVADLKNNFKTKRTKSHKKLGFFYGIDALKALVAEMDAGGYDGLRCCFGQHGLGDARIEIIAQPVKFDSTVDIFSQTILANGDYFISIQDAPTEPPVAECPPLKICQ
jgi:hypothetical protein